METIGKRSKDSDDKTRIAIINADKCYPKKCHLECKKGCPVNAQSKMCIEVEKISKIALINETF
jgi:ATP-binding cassette, sub-family E, member 1